MESPPPSQRAVGSMADRMDMAAKAARQLKGKKRLKREEMRRKKAQKSQQATETLDPPSPHCDQAESSRQGPEQQAIEPREVAAEECTMCPGTTWATFVANRAQLLREAITSSVLTGKFNDIVIHVYTKRGRRSGQATAHTAIHARTSFLEASSLAFKELFEGGKREPRLIPFVTDDYDYTDDSDLEDENDPESELSEFEANVSFDLLDSPTSLHSVDLARAPSSTSESAVDKPEGADQAIARTLPPADNTPSNTQNEVVFASYGAARTWQVLITYLQCDMVLTFNRLKSNCPFSSDLLEERPSCSPKSMYRLATKLQLPHLAKLSEDAIIADLRLANIVRELFSDFTWRYPEILKREVAFFREHSQKRRVRKDLREAFGDVVLGKYPHGQTVLVALFDNLIPAL